MKRRLLLLVSLVATALSLVAADKKIVLIAGKPSHPPGMHEFRAGMLLLQQCLQATPGISVSVHANGWPESNAVFDGAEIGRAHV